MSDTTDRNSIQYGFCCLGVVPVRKEAKSSAEQVTQLLFGDVVEVIEEISIDNKIADSWLKIRNLYDDYQGWIDKRNIIAFTDEEYTDYCKKYGQTYYIVSSSVAKIKMDGDVILIPMAAKLPEKNFIAAGHSFSLLEGSVIRSDKLNPLLIKAVSLLYLNTPYQWGGKNIFGMDCSGFTQNVFSFAGIKLQRDASLQALQGREIAFEEIKDSDLCFFDNTKGNITHVGIYLGANQIIHCSGKVRIDTIDNNGILTKDDANQYSHHLCKVIRVF